MLETLSRKKWLLTTVDDDLVRCLKTATGLSAVASRLLANRGVDSPQAAGVFLNPAFNHLLDPFLLADMRPAADKLLEAVRRGKLIAIYGDYDVDGITATAMLVDFLRRLSARVVYFIPDRIQDGYGIQVENLLALKRLGVDLLITVDCGVGSRDEVTAGKAMGLDFIITDHHPFTVLPPDVPVINPRRPDCDYPCKDLAGAGVAFKFLQGAYRHFLDQGGEIAAALADFDFGPALEMASIGTIGDVVSLTGENRTIASLGLRELRASKRAGTVALKESAGIRGELAASAVAYLLAPRLNAGGRLGKADRGVQLLLERDLTKARSLAATLNEENAERQRVELTILDDCLALLDTDPDALPAALVLDSPRWHPGVIGIVASRLVDKFHRPTALLAGGGDQLKGSIRSIPECPLPRLLPSFASNLLSYGGHELAAGFLIRRDKIESFRNDFIKASSSHCNHEAVTPTLAIDMELDLQDLRMPLIDELALLEPYGCGNPPPTFLSKRVTVNGEPQIFGDRHLRLFVTASAKNKPYRAQWFKMGHVAPSIWSEAPVDLVYTPEIRKTSGRAEIILNLRDIARDYRIEYAY